MVMTWFTHSRLGVASENGKTTEADFPRHRRQRTDSWRPQSTRKQPWFDGGELIPSLGECNTVNNPQKD